MKILSELRRYWEKRFPGFTGEWNHWKIIGDEIELAVINGMDLFTALNIVEENYGKYETIKTIRVVVDASSNITKEEKRSTVISNYFNNELKIKELLDKSTQ